MRAALELVGTPTVLFVEHDTPLVGDIPFDDMVQVLTRGGRPHNQADLIRLHHEASVLEPHEHLMVDREVQTLVHHPAVGYTIPARRTVQWSQRPHLARTDFYRSIINEFFGEHSCTMIEDVMHGVVDYHWRTYGERGWERFKLWLYTPDGDMKRSTHLDGRRRADGELDPKFEAGFVFAYDGNTPDGAPAPTGTRDEDQ